MKKKTAILGATGSIGRNALDVIRLGKDDFEPVLFTAHKDAEALVNLKKEFPGALLALTGAETSPSPEIDFIGLHGLLDAIGRCNADIAVNGIAGAAGLEPSLACLDAAMDLALANKETLVMAGPLVFEKARQKNAKIIPVDSEHSAIYKLIEAHGRENVEEIILTASGGPFRNFSLDKLKNVAPAEALAHPTWNMGPKITIDSASLANKGLEVIEAVRLFGFPPDKIKVRVHPQSIVHSMIRLKDGAVYAQMSKPDMRLPIHEALHSPATSPSPFGFLDFSNLTLTFEEPDMKRFPMLGLAYKACSLGPLHPAVYNAANEEAVEAFLKGKIPFLEIPRIVGYVLDDSWPGDALDLAHILEADRKAREKARGLINRSTNADS
ncbi:1-deoxy-D-xylulose-5-phosphate reductoisomerase [Leadbettera azotonutricia]|uniref:1-deoxy-D-xylulose 5-phosphate reductoisomerase n=1 Tax=Leadbettera azotonutricia (strain ATCC BAA-888 / DSM 13862 / ZAS-9) TaxID=545695 RepID=F5YB07_LEAAZ|nr:1-deoxy-D-xylulose-5-phosphate reductoisomerase [Leadbettera azotonutricia]AEF80639.1 1-deoxy-D-xylulose 5-phosphate reductoisomerase [Leadbettera azotonutricia ZAS-9]